MTNPVTVVQIEGMDSNSLRGMMREVVEQVVTKGSNSECIVIKYDDLPEHITPVVFRLLTGKSKSTYTRHIADGKLKVREIGGGKRASYVIAKGDFIDYLNRFG